MMAKKTGFDFSEMLNLYDPEKIAKMFDPKNMFAQVPGMKPGGVDFTEIMERNRKSYQAMVEANQEAALTYRDMLEKQMAIFARLTETAANYGKNVDRSPNPDAVRRNMEIYTEAVEKALEMMKEMAESTREANQKAFEKIQKQVIAAMKDLQDK